MNKMQKRSDEFGFCQMSGGVVILIVKITAAGLEQIPTKFGRMLQPDWRGFLSLKNRNWDIGVDSKVI